MVFSSLTEILRKSCKWQTALNINTIKSKLEVLKAKLEEANKNESKLAMYALDLELEIVSMLWLRIFINKCHSTSW